MTTGSAYKQTTRTQRIIRTEDNYSGGMMYVNTPLDTGYSRIILNLDLADNDRGLKPRAGLKTFATTKYLIYDQDTFKTVFPYCIANSVMRRDSDGAVKYTDTVVLDEKVYKIGPYVDGDDNFPIEEITSPDMPFDKSRAHCFAWYGDLYHMHKDGLYHFNEAYTHTEIVPRNLEPKEAVATGYNMLHKSPYRFNNTDAVSVSGDILGILPYFKNGEAEGDLAIKAGPNTPIYLRVYLAVVNSDSIKYQYKIEWRESTQGNWEEITKVFPKCDWDESSSDGVAGSTLFKDGILAEWSTPSVLSGMPIYIRVTLKCASENVTLYNIRKTSTVNIGTTLGEGTTIPNLASNNLNFVYEKDAYNNFITPVSCKIDSKAVFPKDTYISYCRTKGLRSMIGNSVDAWASIKYTPSTGIWDTPHSKDTVVLTDPTGVTKPISSLEEYLYNALDAKETALPTLEEKTMWLKLPKGYRMDSTFYALIGNTAISTCTLIGPATIPVQLELTDTKDAVYLKSLFDPGICSGNSSYTIVNIKAVENSSITSNISYTIGAGTVLYIGDLLNDAEVYQTHTFTEKLEPVANSTDYFTATALSKVAPVTSIVSLSFKENSTVASVIKYDLFTAKGMCCWKDRLVLWGVASPEPAVTQYQEDSANLLFFSELNDPSYFPYPYNVSTFTEPILKALPFGDDLLVITATSMHLVVLNEDGLSWTTTQIQTNLRFDEHEMDLVHVVNNMVLFKSGPQFYLLVPSTVNVGNLVVAPITKNIKQIFDNPRGFITKLFTQIFSKTSDSALITAISNATLEWKLSTFIDFEQIHITYTAFTSFENKSVKPTVDFIYNTTSRTWKTYLYSAPIGFYPIRRDAVKGNVYLGYYGKDTLLNTKCINFKYYQFDSTTLEDEPLCGDSVGLFSCLHYLDTGARNQDPAYNKRYREAQLRVTNHTTDTLKLTTEYALDGYTYIPLYAPQATLSVNDAGDVTVDLTYDDTPTVTGNAVLAGDDSLNTDSDNNGITVIQGYNHDITTDNVFSFSLLKGYESKLESPFTIKLRTTILGKGYAPSLRILSRNKTAFTILDHTWVYRIMNAR